MKFNRFLFTCLLIDIVTVIILLVLMALSTLLAIAYVMVLSLLEISYILLKCYLTDIPEDYNDEDK